MYRGKVQRLSLKEEYCKLNQVYRKHPLPCRNNSLSLEGRGKGEGGILIGSFYRVKR